MTKATSLSRRDFTRLAAASTGAAVFGCSSGILSAAPELQLKLTGKGRLFDGTGNVLATEALAPGTASGPTGSGLIRTTSTSSGIGMLRMPTPGIIGFVRSPVRKPQVSTRVDRASDGTIVESTFERLGDGVPIRRTVRVPSHGIELIDAFDFGPLGDISVFERRRIEVRQQGRLVADLRILASGEIQLVRGPRFRPGRLAQVFLPEELQAQSDCGIDLLLHFISATLGVMAALGTCASGPWCIVALFGALIQWAEVISEMEACGKT